MINKHIIWLSKYWPCRKAEAVKYKQFTVSTVPHIKAPPHSNWRDTDSLVSQILTDDYCVLEWC